jgi:hypothetical protein
VVAASQAFRDRLQKNYVPAQGFEPKPVFDWAEESLKTLAQIGCAYCQVQPSRCSQTKHGLHLLKNAYESFQRGRIKIRPHRDLSPIAQYHFQRPTLLALEFPIPQGQLNPDQPTTSTKFAFANVPPFQLAPQGA